MVTKTCGQAGKITAHNRPSRRLYPVYCITTKKNSRHVYFYPPPDEGVLASPQMSGRLSVPLPDVRILVSGAELCNPSMDF